MAETVAFYSWSPRRNRVTCDYDTERSSAETSRPALSAAAMSGGAA